VNTHLGEVLNFNDTVLGYDMDFANVSAIEGYKAYDLNLPDVILVKKTFPKLRKRQKRRFWKLKHFEDNGPNMTDGGLIPEVDEDAVIEDPDEQKPKGPKRMSKKAIKKIQKAEKGDVKNCNDYELFLRDLEDDPELRQNVALHRDEDVMAELEAKIANMGIND
jgi:nonsense-mediated mRNA decay protein 3